MPDLIVDPAAVGAAATEISRCASRLMSLELTSHAGLEGTASTFSRLSGQFAGASSDMSAVASSADERVAESLANVSGTVSAFSELVLGAKNTTVETDHHSAGQIKDAVAYPARQGGQQTDHVVPLSVLLSVQ
ncbi:hypothetical protein GDN83_10670 [Gordonia jinghuaiqii]|uniref:Uncharacterized protein n=1 Tax=Gordonia jinghuaiqii TaxID=2758710 RepID=A0A7D7LWC6_9ACTN|nr:hypothetical protein [Gordonia jinghuaiqii]MCR5978186.1 hypothetical protein [Gordonia jinghuaiqii]QMT01358.1 hypothetical protein H1R19_21470 [Gordonia jinghuaiqii]